MTTVPAHPHESDRLALLRELAVLDTAPEAVFDVVTRLVSTALKMPIALVSLVDGHRQWFKSAVGVDTGQTPRDDSFCAHVVGSSSLLVVPDAQADARFADAPLVRGAPHVRFYAGAPLLVEGLPMGALCVVDTAPREFDEGQCQVLRDAAAMVSHCLSQRLERERLRAAEEIAQILAEHSCDWQWETDAEGRLTRIDGDIEHATGLAASAFLGRRLRDCAAGESPRFVQAWAAIDAAVRGGRHWRGLPVGWRSATGFVSVVLDALPRLDAHGAHVGYRGTATDLDRQSRALDDARRAEAASRAKTDFLSRMSHELRTPLNAIIGFSRLMLSARRNAAEPGLDDGVGQIHAAGEHLLQLVDGMLDLQSIEKGALSMSLETVCLEECARAVVDMCRADAALRDIRIEIDADSLLGRCVRADRRRLKQVLLNLVSNALKYGAAGSTVRLRGESLAQNHVLQVIDQGPGLTSDQRARLFQPFERLGHEHSAIPGTGLGLVISQRLMQEMGGTLDVASEPGHGSVFSVTLPAAARPLLPAGADAAAARAARPAEEELPASVVYVEDNPVNAMLFEAVLALHPAWTLHIAPDGAAAIALLRELTPDLLVVDAHLSDTDGIALLQRVRALRPALAQVPAVMFTADAMAEHVAASRAAGFVEHWTKPMNVEGVVASMRVLLGARQRAAALSDG